MTLRNKKRLLSLGAVCLTGLAAAAVTWGISDPLPHETNGVTLAAAPAAAKTNTASKPPEQVTVENFKAYWERPLRQPLYDPPPPPPPEVEKKPPRPLTAKLLATMIEPENSVAMLQLGDGQVVYRKVDETLGAQDSDAILAEIQPGSVKVRRDEEVVELSVDGTRSR